MIKLLIDKTICYSNWKLNISTTVHILKIKNKERINVIQIEINYIILNNIIIRDKKKELGKEKKYVV